MKVVLAVSIAFITILLIAFSVFHFSNRYNSAFEADQQCHSEILVGYSGNPRVDCDHDIETRQWILFEDGLNDSPAKVLERFKY